MEIKELKELHTGDQVFWTDPDHNICSKVYTIQTLMMKGDIVSLTDKDGSCLECFAEELS